jgi:DNA uptake protein ComE-like DNA-binding protein
MPRIICCLIIPFQFVFGLFFPPLLADELQSLRKCTLVATDWGDGDSFRIADSSGNEFTVRLYGVDCIEQQVSDDSDARRLRAQRRYFGISNLGGNPQASIAAAKKFGADATDFVKRELSEPFTVHTSFADARGDGRYQRVYAFVICHDGEDLGEKLVRAGLARAFGVYRQTPDGRAREDYRESMKDLELLAAKKGVGIWQATDWDSLPGERQQDRTEAAEDELAKKDPLPDDFQLNPNTAARDELIRLPGVGEVLANRIIEARPFSSIESLSEVPGIGAKKLLKLKPYLKLN